MVKKECSLYQCPWIIIAAILQWIFAKYSFGYQRDCPALLGHQMVEQRIVVYRNNETSRSINKYWDLLQHIIYSVKGQRWQGCNCKTCPKLTTFNNLIMRKYKGIGISSLFVTPQNLQDCKVSRKGKHSAKSSK